MTCRPGLLASGVFWLLCASCAHVQPRPLSPVAAHEWHEDVAYFGRELPKRHKNAFHHVSRDSFERAVTRLDAQVDTLSNEAIYFGLHRITAAVGDGHTGMFVPTNFHRYGIAIRPFGGDYRVVAIVPEAKALLGGRLVRIGGVPIGEAANRTRSILAQDENEWYVRAAVPQWLIVAEAIHELGLSTSADHAVYTAVDSTGQEVSATLSALPIGNRPGWVTAQADTPLYHRLRSAPLWFEPLAHDSCVYVAFNGYTHLARYTGPLWKFVDQHPGTTLIVDMRRNGGGNYKTGLHHMVNPARDRLASGKVRSMYVVIGNATFSAAMANATHFRKECHATLIGEPIGEKPNSYSERRLMTLPRSRLVVSYSVCYYKFQDSDEPPTVMPDVTIEPSWEDYKAGRDPVLEWVLTRLSEPRAGK
jgi:hypothetical protein